jgi:hypothetical protein
MARFLCLIIVMSGLFAGLVQAQVSVDRDGNSMSPGRIEILITAGTTKALESFFGHSALLLVPEGGDWQDGHVVEFLAAINESQASKHSQFYDNILKDLKGLSGQYPFQLVVSPATDYFFRKLVQEQRSIERVILPATKEQKLKLWNDLLDLNAHPKKLGDYYFVRYNCATAVLETLKSAGIQINTRQIIFSSPIQGIKPKNISSLLRAVLLTPYPTLSVPSMLETVQDLERSYRLVLRSEVSQDSGDFLPWSTQALQLLPKLSTENLLAISTLLSPEDQARNMTIRLILQSRPRGPTKLLKYVELPQAFYDVCADAKCAQNVVRELEKLYPRQILQKMAFKNEMQRADAELSIMPEVDLQTSPQALSWKLIVEALRERL